MKKAIIVLVIFSILSMNILPNVSAATQDYDHNELLEYKGYGETMYESIVEQTNFISGRYTENKDYVNESINQITDYAKGWWNEYERISNMPPKEKLREMLNAGGGYALTVGDFFKNLFSDTDKKFTVPEYDGYGSFLNKCGAFSLGVGSGVIAEIYKNGNLLGSMQAGDCRHIGINYDNNNDIYVDFFGRHIVGKYENSAQWNETFYMRETVSGAVQLLSKGRVTFKFKKDGVYQDPSPSNNYSRINNYVRDGGFTNKPLPIPQPKAYLSCPDGTKISMTINGSTFLDVNGKVMQVTKDGTATVSSQICNLGWEKPTIQYIDGTDQVGMTTPDREIIDAETGEKISDGEFDDELEDGCGFVCAIGKMLKGLGDVARSIAGLATKILEGLVGLFVPESLDFVQEKFDETKAKFEEKFAILNTLMDVFSGLSAHESENILMNYTFSLPITGDKEYKLFEFEAINNFIPYMKRFVSGILIMYTLLFVYRKIVGNGGVMEK